MWENRLLGAGNGEEYILEDPGRGEIYKSQGFPKSNQTMKTLDSTFGEKT